MQPNASTEGAAPGIPSLALRSATHDEYCVLTVLAGVVPDALMPMRGPAASPTAKELESLSLQPRNLDTASVAGAA